MGRLWAPFELPLGRLGVHLRPLASQNGAKMVQKLVKNRSKHALRYCIRFFIDFLSILASKPDAPNPNLIEKRLVFIAFKRLKRFRGQVRFGFDFGLQSGACWHQKCSKIQLWGVLGAVLGRVLRVLRARGACKCRSGASCAPQPTKTTRPNPHPVPTEYQWSTG